MGRPKRAADGGLIYHVLNRAKARLPISGVGSRTNWYAIAVLLLDGEVITMPSLADLCSSGFSWFSRRGWSVQPEFFAAPVGCDRLACEVG